MSKKKVTVIIPAFNEEKTISLVIKGVKDYVDEVIVVDDASTDKTVFLAKKEGAIIITHTENQGYDRSIDDGFSLASKTGATIVCTFDADGQHSFQDIPRIVDPILAEAADVVVGKRPKYARITEYLFSVISRIKVGIEDPLCGLKAYDMRVFNDIGFFDRISSIGTQLMFKAKKKGYKIQQKEISLSKRQDDSRFGKRIDANWKIFKAILKILFLKEV